MENQKISQMAKETVLTGEELIPIVKDGSNKNITVGDLKTGLATEDFVNDKIREIVDSTYTLPRRLYTIRKNAYDEFPNEEAILTVFQMSKEELIQFFTDVYNKKYKRFEFNFYYDREQFFLPVSVVCSRYSSDTERSMWFTYSFKGQIKEVFINYGSGVFSAMSITQMNIVDS